MKRKRFTINRQDLAVDIADNAFSRFRGLMLRENLAKNCGLLIVPCNSVHMMFMRFAIDVIYLDKTYRVMKIVRNLRPWIGVSMYLSAHAVLELKGGEAKRLNLSVGQIFDVH